MFAGKAALSIAVSLFTICASYAWDAESYRAGAEDGDSVAQYNLGVCYERGYGVDKDLEHARKWYSRSAAQNYANGQYRLALFAFNGWGGSRDLTTAVSMARSAAEDGHAGAACLLGTMLLQGEGVPQDVQEAAKWFALSAAKGNAEAQFRYAQMIEAKQVEAKSKDEAQSWLEKSAAQSYIPAQIELAGKLFATQPDRARQLLESAVNAGDTSAKASLGRLLFRGAKNLKPDPVAALPLIEAAAEAGDKEMQRLAIECCRAIPGDEAKAKAANWLKRSADSGNIQSLLELAASSSKEDALLLYKTAYQAGSPEGQYEYAIRLASTDFAAASPLLDDLVAKGNLKALVVKGDCLLSGQGMGEADPDAAFLCFKKAAEAGNVDGMKRLASAYQTGMGGTLRDAPKYFEWTLKAANAGAKDCYLMVAVSYAIGKGVAKNPEESFKWYSKANEAGDTKALYYLAVCYLKGFGTKVDEAKAKELFDKAIKTSPDNKALQDAVAKALADAAKQKETDKKGK